MTGEKKESATRYHRKTLLTAADRLLTEHGYDGMNMNLLAKEAGYSKATVYVYFESKDEIVRELCIERLTLARSEMALVLKSDLDKEGKFTEIKRLLDEFAEGDRTYFDFICASGDDTTDSDNAARLSTLVSDVLDDLTVLAPVEELKARWYAYYGRIKTQSLFK